MGKTCSIVKVLWATGLKSEMRRNCEHDISFHRSEGETPTNREQKIEFEPGRSIGVVLRRFGKFFKNGKRWASHDDSDRSMGRGKNRHDTAGVIRYAR